MTQNERWLSMFDTYMDFIRTNKRCPSKYKPEERNLVNWAKYNRKKIKAGTLEADKVQLFEELLALRSTEHTGGRKPKNTSYNAT